MGLLGLPLLVTLVLVTVAALAGGVWTWPRLAGRGPRMVLARIGVLGACQLLLITTVMVAINRHFAFYATWRELAGLGGGEVAVADEGGAGDGAAHGLVKLKPEFSLGDDPAEHGVIENVRIRGPVSGLAADAYVYLPPQYFRQEERSHRFPVVLVLSGYPGALRNLVKRLQVPQKALEEIRAGRIRPAVYVMMRPTPAPPRDTECVDVPGGPQSRAYYAQDVPEVIKAGYRVAAERGGWGVFGLSTGGHCALKLAMLDPDAYSAAAAISGYYHAIQDVTTGDLYGGSRQVRNENDLLWRLRNRPAPPVSVLLTTSRVGERNRADTERFLKLVRPPMRASSIVLDSGGHNFDTWNRVLPPVLRWMSGRLTSQGQ
ncbi:MULTISPECIES: alpha/beta hydrolase [Thermomonospora]|uniref:Enterochelin esterase-like enzyme n=1 Tax=Thermomonospora cellulosilytica TaxID=1411118 RepID=A0A7W3MWH6_9ACTN|nr:MULTISPECIES: alpha/beta hydrolase-fold protein [Thermomonospora]MBA9003200.1 enterochelin esterase-like enzyme [Thermomonospora cellulosilytica]